MPLKIVKKHRKIYKHYFMHETLSNAETKFVVPAFDKQQKLGQNCGGISDRYILVTLDADLGNPKVPAAHALRIKDDVPFSAIVADRSLREMSKIERKAILAHEWIHAMLALRDGVTAAKTVVNKEELVTFLYALDEMDASYWEDQDSEKFELWLAIRELLVSTESVEDMLKEDYNSSVKKLKEEVYQDFESARDLRRKFIKRFSLKWSVDEKLVRERLVKDILK